MERKSRQVRQRIVEAADDLFRANGFDGVSVTDIAARADVGRTTFFRYFGDKAEVVFAKEQAILDAIAAHAEGGPAEVAQTPRQAIEQLRPIVLKICEQASSDADGYALHARLLDQHVELRARDALKNQLAADRLAEVLVARRRPSHPDGRDERGVRQRRLPERLTRRAPSTGAPSIGATGRCIGRIELGSTPAEGSSGPSAGRFSFDRPQAPVEPAEESTACSGAQ
jgi:AcrR family transcriptional regulator